MRVAHMGNDSFGSVEQTGSRFLNKDECFRLAIANFLESVFDCRQEVRQDSHEW